MKKVRKTTRPFRYDLNQIPYDYTVEVTNKFKGLDLIDRVPEELWLEVHNTVQDTGIKTIPKKKKCNKKQNGCLGTSLVAQTIKCLSTMRETWVQSLGREDPLEKEMAIHSSTIAWKIPWTEEPGRLQSMGSQRVGHD